MAEKLTAARRARLWTDYPITELGDKQFAIAPIRECRVVGYDGDKYCKVIVADAVDAEIKRGYIYSRPGRSGSVPCISHRSAHMFARHAARRAALTAQDTQEE